MGFFERIDRHSELFQRMAEATGTDLRDALVDGRLNAHQLPAAIWRCTACTSVEECGHWLAEHGPGSAEAPDYCRNRELLARLAS
jgi:hypothetical protein